MRVLAVGTRNPVKVSAVAHIAEKLLHEKLDVIAVEVASSVPNQPVGLEQTIRGAVNRAKQAASSVPSAEFGIGIEAGLVKVPKTLTGYLDIQFAAIVDKKGKVTIGCGSGFEYPPEVLNEVLSKGKEIGDVMESLTRIENIGERIGAIGFLSHGQLDRQRLTEQAILMAFIPRINKELYFKRGDKGDLA
nr:inosine/xanthosine triphosphatase [Candidatus Njordarchaeota archaeon]